MDVPPLVLRASVIEEFGPEPLELRLRVLADDEVHEPAPLERGAGVTDHFAERRVHGHEAPVGVDEDDADRGVVDDPLEPAMLVVEL